MKWQLTLGLNMWCLKVECVKSWEEVTVGCSGWSLLLFFWRKTKTHLNQSLFGGMNLIKSSW
jgi:hypothetical protein